MSNPFFSIITPSLQRKSLLQCCESIDRQSFTDFEHIVALDCAPDEMNHELLTQIESLRRTVFCCGQKFGNYGNKARVMACDKAKGMYYLWIDDDNRMYSDHSLTDIATALTFANYPAWAISPIHRHGRIFFNDPPGMCMTDTGNIVVKREIGRWPDIELREADGVLVEGLKANYSYSAFPNIEPIILMEYSSNGV